PVFVFSVAAFNSVAQEAAQPRVAITDFDVEERETPDYTGLSHPNAGRAKEDWVQLYVEYTCVGGEDGWIDDLTFEWYVLLHGGKVPRLVMTETVTYMDVESEKDEHHAVVYIRPQTIKRYFDERGRLSPRNIVLHLDVKVGNFKVAEYDFPKSRPQGIPAQWWLNPRVNMIENALLSRDKTPFAPLDYDFYEYIKPPRNR
ncbi:MAG: hypothetical protein K9N51_11115, partial [Candidatus Pacebacteria bacterium]|nr:hypothetical protein [Candidatus Paceibacterota bacterium]